MRYEFVLQFRGGSDEITEIIRSHPTLSPLSKHKEGRLNPIFRVRRKLRHVSLYIILVLCPAAGVLVEIQRDPYEINLIPKTFHFPAYPSRIIGVRGRVAYAEEHAAICRNVGWNEL